MMGTISAIGWPWAIPARMANSTHSPEAACLRVPAQMSRIPCCLEILDKILQDTPRLGQVRIGEDRNEFIRLGARGKPPDGAEVLIDEQSHAPDRLLRRIVAQIRDDRVQFLQGKNDDRVGFPRAPAVSTGRDSGP